MHEVVAEKRQKPYSPSSPGLHILGAPEGGILTNEMGRLILLYQHWIVGGIPVTFVGDRLQNKSILFCISHRSLPHIQHSVSSLNWNEPVCIGNQCAFLVLRKCVLKLITLIFLFCFRPKYETQQTFMLIFHMKEVCHQSPCSHTLMGNWLQDPKQNTSATIGCHLHLEKAQPHLCPPLRPGAAVLHPWNTLLSCCHPPLTSSHPTQCWSTTPKKCKTEEPGPRNGIFCKMIEF